MGGESPSPPYRVRGSPLPRGRFRGEEGTPHGFPFARGQRADTWVRPYARRSIGGVSGFRGGKRDPAPGPHSSGTAGGHVGPPLRSTVEGGSHPHPGPLPSRERGKRGRLCLRGNDPCRLRPAHQGDEMAPPVGMAELTTVAGDWIPAPYRVRGRLFAGMTDVGVLPLFSYQRRFGCPRAF